MLTLALNRKGEVEYNSNEDVVRRLEHVRKGFSPKLCDLIEVCCLSEKPPTFTDLRAMKQTGTGSVSTADNTDPSLQDSSSSGKRTVKKQQIFSEDSPKEIALVNEGIDLRMVHT